MAEPAELLDLITKKVQAAEKAGTPDAEVGPLITEFRSKLGMTPNQFAQKLGISVQTVHRWEKTFPPFHQVFKLRSLVEEGNGTTIPPIVDDSPRDHVLIEGKKVAVRSLDYLLQRELDSDEIWILRGMSYYLSGWEGPTRELMISHLVNSQANYYFVFREAKPGELGYPAQESFARFKQALLEREADLGLQEGQLARRAHGLPVVDAEDMIRLGLGQVYVATVILKYSKEGRKRLKRSFDIFLETPIAVYEDIMSFDRFEEDQSYVMTWNEVPPKRATVLMDLWEEVLTRLRSGGSSSEFLGDLSKAKEYKPGRIVEY